MFRRRQESSEDEGGIRLGQFLKLIGMVGTGGESKLLIQDGEVRVNGQVETRRGAHLRTSDVVEVRGRSFRVADYL